MTGSGIEQRTEIMTSGVRQAEGWATRWVIPVIVPDHNATMGPWPKNAALDYAKSVLHLDTPGVTPGGIKRPIGSYTPNYQPGAIKQADYQNQAAAARIDADAVRQGAADPRWVIEIVVDGGE